QRPKILWIGCSDSRVAANQIVDLPPGEVFVHRNIANIVVHTDFNCLAVLEYAVEVLNVEHVVVCGHYGCGGIQVALQERSEGFVENWLEHIRDIYQVHADELEAVEGEARENLLCELNVKKQVQNVCRTSIVEQAWRRGDSLAIHGWIYSLQDGILHDLDVTQVGRT
ncbi:MAG: carbonic anhydrase, partial [Gammaproteobacteria bacterium]